MENSASPVSTPGISEVAVLEWLKGGITQAMVCRLMGTVPKVLLDREAIGMPRRADGKYDLIEILKWHKDNRRGGVGGPGQGASVAKNDDDTYKAKLRRLQYEKAADLLIPKTDARKRHLAMVVQIRATLLAQSEAVAPQLANLGAREAGRVLDQRLRWICHQFEKGWVPLPAALLHDLDALLEKHADAIVEETAGDEETVAITEDSEE